VLDACGLGFGVTVITDGCRAVDLAHGDGDRAFAEMRSAGARLVTLDELD
jgi:nicotinamidase/pyrazinamidase